MNKLLAAYLATFAISSVAGPLPEVTAHSWVVADSSGMVLEGVNTDDVRSIASITKLMTVMIVLDSGQSLTEVIPKKLYNKALTRQTLIDLAMVKSDNNAAKMLCDYYPGGPSECISAMNLKAEILVMTHTTFTDPTGLLNNNTSTAQDLLKLVVAAKNYPTIVEASNKDVVKWLGKKNRWQEFKNTNPLVGKGSHFLVSKTGFISKSGGCIVMMLETINGIRTVVLLGSKNTKTRIPEAKLISTIM